MMNLVQLLQNIGCKSARNDGMDKISSLRDSRWVEMFAEMGYDKGEFIFPDGRHSSFFLVLPDGNIASADNVMCGNGFYAIANELGIDADAVLGEEPYGDFIMYTDEDGVEDEDTAISIWMPEEFQIKLQQCQQLANKQFNESRNINKKNTIKLTESELKKVISESVKRILSEKRSLKSQSLYDIIKQHGGVKSNPCFDLANMMDEDIIGIVDYETIYYCKNEKGLKDYAIKKGFKLDISDTVEYMQLNDGTYMLGVLRGGAFDYTNSKDRERKSGDFEALCNKRDERQRNRYTSSPNYYKWENEDAEDLFKNPFFRRKEGVWSDKDFRSNRITNAKRK